MTDLTRSPIVVGIDGSTTSDFALTWAADQAARRAVPLVVAHAIGLLPAEAMSVATVDTVIRESAAYGRQVVDDALKLVERDYPALQVTAVLSEALARGGVSGARRVSHPADQLAMDDAGLGFLSLRRQHSGGPAAPEAG